MKIKIDIVIPVLNEESLLESNIKQILKYISQGTKNNYNYKIIIADNGSVDKTEEIGKKLSLDYEGKVFYHKVFFRGVGLALKSAWSVSDADIIGYMDLDLATELRHIPEAISSLIVDDKDIVYGSRLHKRSKVIGRSLKRELTSRIFNFILRGYLGVNISDGMCGFKFMKRKCLKGILEGGANSDGWFFCTEILIIAEWQKLKLFELPVVWTDSPNSKVSIIKLSLEYLKAMKNIKNKYK
jgi:glycosyltransferase involved in cell wall biosynthesis